MTKEQVVTTICDTGVIAVIRAEHGEQARKIVDACLQGGIRVLEITFTVPYAHKLIEELAVYLANTDAVLGAGTVLDPETARIAILSGAEFVVSPYLSENTVRLCNRYRIACMPGAMTLKEIVEAMETGADLIKLFPGEAFGPSMIKAVKGPIPQACIVPTGGVDIDNCKEWIKAGASALGVGSSLTGGYKTGNYASITQKAEELVRRVRQAREEMNLIK